MLTLPRLSLCATCSHLGALLWTPPVTPRTSPVLGRLGTTPQKQQHRAREIKGVQRTIIDNYWQAQCPHLGSVISDKAVNVLLPFQSAFPELTPPPLTQSCWEQRKSWDGLCQSPWEKNLLPESRISLHNLHWSREKKFPHNEGHPFNQNINPRVNFLNTFEPQGQKLQMQIKYISYI